MPRRPRLDPAIFNFVRAREILLSDGFTVDKIREFERSDVPVDFTADVVLVDGKPCAKTGRTFHPNARLERVTLHSSPS